MNQNESKSKESCEKTSAYCSLTMITTSRLVSVGDENASWYFFLSFDTWLHLQGEESDTKEDSREVSLFHSRGKCVCISKWNTAWLSWLLIDIDIVRSGEGKENHKFLMTRPSSWPLLLSALPYSFFMSLLDSDETGIFLMHVSSDVKHFRYRSS